MFRILASHTHEYVRMVNDVRVIQVREIEIEEKRQSERCDIRYDMMKKKRKNKKKHEV